MATPIDEKRLKEISDLINKQLQKMAINAEYGIFTKDMKVSDEYTSLSKSKIPVKWIKKRETTPIVSDPYTIDYSSFLKAEDLYEHEVKEEFNPDKYIDKIAITLK